MAMVFNCPHCGAQNFVSQERLKRREKTVACWVCSRPFSWKFLERTGKRAAKSRETGDER
jgi:predicted Zn finger-like uncharacterized protein